MRIHHLNCGTLRPLGGRRVNGDRPPFLAARMVCHCLLIETDRGLVLVDSGFGLSDIERVRTLRSTIRPPGESDRADPLARRLRRHAFTRFATRARFDPAETAVRQVAALGYSPEDVRDVVLTHLDSDHAGGLPDLPAARVHVARTEHSAATSSESSDRPTRYWPHQWAHGPDWVLYGEGDGERWFGFDGVRELEGLPDMAFVPLPGHSPGQCGVALRVEGNASGKPWLLHAADAYFDHREVDPVAPHSTPGLAAFQKRVEFDGPARRQSRAKLRELVAEHGGEVELFCSHDPVELDRYRAERVGTARPGATLP